MRRTTAGFSLVELLIVVAIILIIAAIAIPNLLRSRIAANEAAAATSIRVLVNCALIYSSSNPNVGYPINVTNMGPNSMGGDDCIDESLVGAANGGAPKAGYVYTYIPTTTIGAMNFGFVITAVPAQCGQTGNRTFFTDESGVIRYVHDIAGGCPAADVNSPILQ